MTSAFDVTAARWVLKLCLAVALVSVCMAKSTPAQSKDATPKALPVQVQGASANVLSFSWEDLEAGRAGFSLFSTSKDTLDVNVLLTPLTNSPEIIPLALEPASGQPLKLSMLQPQRFGIAIPSNQKFKLQPGSHYAVLSILDSAGRFAPLVIQLQVSIPNIQPALGKITLVATRDVPFTNAWKGSVLLPLRFPSASSELPQLQPRQGFIRRDAGGIGLVTWHPLQTGSGAFCAELTVDSLPSAGRYEGEIDFGPAQDKNSVTALVVNGRDFVAWPVLVIAFGVFLAWWVNRYVGVLRLVWVLRKQEAELGKAFRDSQAKFESLLRGGTAARYSIADAVDSRRQDLCSQLSTIEKKWTTSLDNDDDYKNAVKELQTLQELIAQWPQFGSALQALGDSLGRADSEIVPGLVLPHKEEKPTSFATAHDLLQGRRLSLDQLARQQDNVIAATATMNDWREGNRQAKAVTSSWFDLRAEKLAPSQQAALASTEPHLVATWEHLWTGNADTIKSVTSPNGDLDQARIAIAQITEELQQPARLSALSLPSAAPSSMFEAVMVPESISNLPASDSRRAELFSRAMKLGDKGAALLAFAIALLTGLSTKYFGQPFGTVEDYLGLFLWAVGTKAALDIVTSVIGKFSSQS